jgi:hypothetical protein
MNVHPGCVIAAAKPPYQAATGVHVQELMCNFFLTTTQIASQKNVVRTPPNRLVNHDLLHFVLPSTAYGLG